MRSSSTATACRLRVEKKRGRLLTRKRARLVAPLSRKSPPKARALPDCILDGEIAALDKAGVSNFGDLQSALSEGKTGGLVYLRLRSALPAGPGSARPAADAAQRRSCKTLLQRQLPESDRHPLRRALRILRPGDAGCGLPHGLGGHHLQSGGRALSPRARQRLDESEVPRRPGSGDRRLARRRQQLRSLLAGAYRDGAFMYMGRIGTGYNVEIRRRIAEQAEAAGNQDVPPSPTRRRAAGSRICIGSSRSWWRRSNSGTSRRTDILRQASYKGLREDKAAQSVVSEPQPRPSRCRNRERAAGRETSGSKDGAAATRADDRRLAISHPDKALWPASEPGPPSPRLDLARYYEAAAARMLPHIADRPLSIVRAPEGIGGEQFFQRHVLLGRRNSSSRWRCAGEKKPYLVHRQRRRRWWRWARWR